MQLIVKLVRYQNSTQQARIILLITKVVARMQKHLRNSKTQK